MVVKTRRQLSEYKQYQLINALFRHVIGQKGEGKSRKSHEEACKRLGQACSVSKLHMNHCEALNGQGGEFKGELTQCNRDFNRPMQVLKHVINRKGIFGAVQGGWALAAKGIPPEVEESIKNIKERMREADRVAERMHFLALESYKDDTQRDHDQYRANINHLIDQYAVSLTEPLRQMLDTIAWYGHRESSKYSETWEDNFEENLATDMKNRKEQFLDDWERPDLNDLHYYYEFMRRGRASR